MRANATRNVIQDCSNAWNSEDSLILPITAYILCYLPTQLSNKVKHKREQAWKSWSSSPIMQMYVLIRHLISSLQKQHIIPVNNLLFWDKHQWNITCIFVYTYNIGWIFHILVQSTIHIFTTQSFFPKIYWNKSSKNILCLVYVYTFLFK